MALQKISIVGTEGAGKTVFITALTHTLSSGMSYPSIAAQNAQTRRYTAKIMDQLETGEWPRSTDSGTKQELKWVWHDRNRNEHELHVLDCAGQDFRTIFESENDNELSEAQRTLKNELYGSHLIILLVNLQKAIEIYQIPGKHIMKMEIEFAPAEAIRKLCKANVTIFAIFTQYDRYAERMVMEWAGNHSLALQHYLPDLYAALRETNSGIAWVSAVEVEQRINNWGVSEAFPKKGWPIGNLGEIVKCIDGFLIRNKPVLEKQFSGTQYPSSGQLLASASSSKAPGFRTGANSGPGSWADAKEIRISRSFNYFETFFNMTLDGCSNRVEFWVFTSINLFILSITYFLTRVFVIGNGLEWVIIFFIFFSLAILIPSFCVAVRRLHDSGNPSSMIFIGLIPGFGILALMFLMLMKSSDGYNE